MLSDAVRINKLAQKMYSDYGDCANWKNYQGLPMPTWDELPAKIQSCWENVAFNNDPLNPKVKDLI